MRIRGWLLYRALGIGELRERLPRYPKAHVFRSQTHRWESSESISHMASLVAEFINPTKSVQLQFFKG